VLVTACAGPPEVSCSAFAGTAVHGDDHGIACEAAVPF
jgi:hypothetical protein